MSVKVIAAIIVCKALRLVSRLLHRGGTAMPGRYALKICPRLLSVLAKDVKTVAITGTNGKTTGARMIEQALTADELSFFSNRSGANLISGIVTEFVMNSSVFGKCRKEYAVIECDEAASVNVFEQMKPAVIVVTNLFPDQLDRFGDLAHTRELIKTACMNAPRAVLCLNADCEMTASLAGELDNETLTFGFAKNSPDADFCVKDILRQDSRGSSIIMNMRGEERLVEVNLPAIYNVYNAAAAAAAVCALGLSRDIAVRALAEFKCGFGRMEEFEIGAGARMMLVKNPAGCDLVIDFLKDIKERFSLIISLNDRSGDGKDISWIWDVDFESLCGISGRIKRLVVAGDRAEELRLRLKYAGLDETAIELERDYEKMLGWMAQEQDKVFIMPTYSAMLDMRQVLIAHCGGSQFWE